MNVTIPVITILLHHCKESVDHEIQYQGFPILKNKVISHANESYPLHLFKVQPVTPQTPSYHHLSLSLSFSLSYLVISAFKHVSSSNNNVFYLIIQPHVPHQLWNNISKHNFSTSIVSNRWKLLRNVLSITHS